MRKTIAVTAALVAALIAVVAVNAIGDTGAPQLSDGTSIAYRFNGNTVTGKQWLITPSQAMVDDGNGGVRVIDRSDVVTTPTQTVPTTPTDTTPTQTTPTTPVPPAVSRPFSDDSPFNTPVGTPTVLSNSASLVSSSGMSGGLPSPISTDRGESVNYDHPTYYPKATDPLATVTFRNSGYTVKIPVPNYAIVAGASDHHICIVYGGWEYNLWNATKSGTAGNYTFTAQIGGRLPADGQGIKTKALIDQYGSSIEGGVEAKFSERAGIITAAEMQAGQINHALFVVASGAAAGTSGAVYPAYNSPTYATNDRVRMGTRFWLNMTAAQIDATSAPAYEKVIAKAAAQYGVYVGDKGGAGFQFQLESSTPYNAAGATNPWDSYFAGQGVRSSGTYGYVMQFRTSAIWSHLVAIAPPAQ